MRKRDSRDGLPMSDKVRVIKGLLLVLWPFPILITAYVFLGTGQVFFAVLYGCIVGYALNYRAFLTGLRSLFARQK